MDHYFWLKAAHVFVAFVFVSGLILNGFLLVHLQPGSPPSQQLLTAARRWNGPIIGLALAAVWIFGLVLAYFGHWFAAGWLSVKMLLVLALSALHGMEAGALRRMLLAPERPVSGLLRASAAITFVFVALIAILVIVKPF